MKTNHQYAKQNVFRLLNFRTWKHHTINKTSHKKLPDFFLRGYKKTKVFKSSHTTDKPNYGISDINLCSEWWRTSGNSWNNMRSKDFTVVSMMLALFWVLVQCSFIGRCHFGDTYCLHLQGRSDKLTNVEKSRDQQGVFKRVTERGLGRAWSKRKTALFRSYRKVSFSWWQPVFIPSGYKKQASMTYLGRSHHPYWCCDGAQSLSRWQLFGLQRHVVF
jgi:hypothetical protein